MTNEQIVYNERLRLVNKGLLGIMRNGEPEPMHTLHGWWVRGYKVKKGQKAIAAFPIWKHTGRRVNKKTGEEESGRMIQRKAHFFASWQVERRRK